MTNLVGQTLGGYAVLEQLGAGGMGAVFKARQPVLDRVVALKVITPQVAQDPSFIARFQHEAKSAARLNHPNIVQVYAAGEDTGTHFMVSEFVEGESLHQRLSREGRMDPQEALAICVFVAEGLKYAWDEAQIIHRDIKPANIFLSNKGAVKVGDLGLAKSVGSNAGSALTQSGMMMGTPYYCSPEQAQAVKDLDFRADIYSLGCTLYHMLSGKRPYETGPDQSAMSIMVKQIHDPPPAILQVLPTCPMPVVLLLNKMLSKHPTGRHASYDELIADMHRVHDMLGQPQPVAPASPPPVSAVAKKKSPTLVYAAAALIAALLVAGLFVWVPWKHRSTGILPVQPRAAAEQRRQDAGLTPSPAVERTLERKDEPKPAVAAQPTVEPVPAKPPEKKTEPVVEAAKPMALVAPTPTQTTTAAPTVGSATTRPAELPAATKEAPRTNSLGMKFVPVPGTTVLFCIWETRVQDFEAFVKATNYSLRDEHVTIPADAWKRPGFSQGPTHPVVMVSWEDATAFCRWLTDQERREGRLAAQKSYRLPTDAEWSVAVGLANETGRTPSEKGKTTSDIYPWGREWPLPSGAGNYADEAAKRKHSNWTILQGYEDGYVETAPVGSFKPNRFGLYDLGGNVWEWCEDWYDGNQKYRVVRGGSYLSGDQKTLSSSYRLNGFPIPCHCGFRVVLADSGFLPETKQAPPSTQPAVNDESFIAQVVALPPEQQVARVMARLKELNPRFDGKETHKIENGAVTELSFSTVGVADITPLRALKWLRKLVIAPTALNQKGVLTDLAPLQGLPLTWLWCHNNSITDLAPLRGMPLTTLSFSSTQVGDLSPLSGMKLSVLSFSDTPVRDLAPLAAMPVTVLWCNNTQVTDLSPLQALPLQELKCDFVPARDAAVLRSIKTLTKINDMASAAFWIRVGPIATTAATRQPTTVAVSGTQKTMITSTGMELVWIPPGEFMAGSTPAERTWAESNGLAAGYMKNEGEQPRKVKISQPFWIGRTEVTVGQWKQFIAATSYVTDAEKAGESFAPLKSVTNWGMVKGASWKDPNFGFKPKDNHPVSCISWNDAVAFCVWLDQRERKQSRLASGQKIRLPTEAEWEYACRAGSETKFWWGDSEEGAGRRMNFYGSEDGFEFVSPVDHYGSRGRNKFGLADMLGNVFEWCLDDYDPSGLNEESHEGTSRIRVCRGGTFAFAIARARCAYRATDALNSGKGHTGFRVCCGVPEGRGQATGTSTTVSTTTRISPAPAATVVVGASTSPPLVTSTGIELVWILPGEFMLGSTAEEQEWAAQNGCPSGWEKCEGSGPRKTVIREGFWLARTEATQGQWKQFIAATGYVTDGEKSGTSTVPKGSCMRWQNLKGANWKNPSFGFKPKDNHPVCCISWNDAMAFCQWLNESEKKVNKLPAGMVFRLPTDAEWEYACRAGTQTKFWWGDASQGWERHMNVRGAEDGFEFVSPADHYGLRGRNKFGLADMLGNVSEWCLDKFDPAGAHEDYNSKGGEVFVFRGGCFSDLPSITRCAFHYGRPPNWSHASLGFRVCCGGVR